MKILLVLLIIFFSIAGVHAETCNCTLIDAPVCGDVNGDGYVTGLDLILLDSFINWPDYFSLNCSIPYCEPCECAGNEVAIVEPVIVSSDYEDVALLFYIFIVPILYLFIAFKKRVNTIGLSMIFLIFAFFVLLFQVIEISVNIIYLIIFLFLFVTSIAGITKQGAD